MSPGETEPLEEKLRRLGYLSNPIDAFVVRERPGGSLWRSILSVGARTALLVGVLLGLLTTAESALLLPGLLHRPHDLFIFGLYQVCLYTAVFFVFGLLWAGVVAVVFSLKPRPVGRPILLRRGFELIGALFIFFYLSLWWNSRAAESTWMEGLAATAVFAALSFWIGRYLGLSAYLVVMQLRPETPVPRLSVTSTRFALVTAGFCVAVFALTLALTEAEGTRLSSEGARVIVPIERRSTPMILLGVDGLSAELFESLARSGRFPRLGRLWDDGARALIDVSETSLVPPVVWTTLTTGIRPAGHGVRDFDTRMLYGVRQPLGSRGPALDLFEALQNLMPAVRVLDRLPLSSAERQGKALWEVLAESGVRSAGINWWASWPAGTGPALVVSDRLFTRLHVLDRSAEGPTPPSSLTSEGETSPPELLERLSRLPRCCRLGDPIEGLLASAFGPRARDAIATATESDGFLRSVTLTLLQEQRPAFLALYLRALDVALRSTTTASAGELQRAAALGPFLEQFVLDVDRWMVELDAQLGPDATVALVGLPGAIELEQNPKLHGVVIVHGAESGPKVGETAKLIRVEDIAPTILWFYGLPLSEELAGTPQLELLAPELRERYPIQTVPSYGARREALEGQLRSSYDESQIEMMRSLGYIE